MVFETALRDDFCRTWAALDLAPADDPCVPQGPTASAYAAYATATRRLKPTYKLNDKATYGYRNIFLRVSAPYRSAGRGDAGRVCVGAGIGVWVQGMGV